MPKSNRQGPPAGRRPRFGPGRGGASSSTGVARAIDVAPTQRRLLRWSGTVTATASLIVTRACLLNAIVASPGYPASTLTQILTPIYESVRIRSVKVIIPPNLATANAVVTQEVALEWSSYLGKDVKISQAVMSNMGASFNARPPPGTRAALWGSANTSGSATTSINEVLFTISHDPNFATPTATIPAVVELDLEFVQANDTVSVITSTTAANINGWDAGCFQVPLDSITPGGIKGAMRFDPLGIQDIRLDSSKLAITIATFVRTN